LCSENPIRVQQGESRPLMNGHTHPLNGALKPPDLQPGPRGSAGDSVAQSRLDRPEAGASSPPSNPTQADPYMFPHSPPGPGNPGPASPGRPGSHQAREKRLKPPPPTYQEAVAATQSQPPPPLLPPPPLSPPPPHPCRLASLTEKPQLSSVSRSPVRVNGSHHYAFSSDLAAPRPSIAPPGRAPPTRLLPHRRERGLVQAVRKADGADGRRHLRVLLTFTLSPNLHVADWVLRVR